MVLLLVSPEFARIVVAVFRLRPVSLDEFVHQVVELFPLLFPEMAAFHFRCFDVGRLKECGMLAINYDLVKIPDQF